MRATFLLLKDLQNELKTEFGEKPNSPNIWIGHVPPKKSRPANAEKPKDNSEPPFIVIRLLEGKVDADSTKAREHEVKAGFLCCVHSKESNEETEAGYNEILNMVDQVLFTMNSKIYWEQNHWKYKEPIKWVMGLPKETSDIYDAGAQEHPFYGAAVIATFTANALERPFKNLSEV